MHTFRCGRFCLWRITCALCSPPEMRISKAAAVAASSARRQGAAETPGAAPRLWLQLPAATRRQLAQQIGQLVSRLRLQSAQPNEVGHDEHDVVER